MSDTKLTGDPEYDLGMARMQAFDQRKIRAPGEIAKSISASVKELRAKRGYTLNALAQLAGISKAHVWDIERGASSNPTLSTIIALADALGTSVERLMGSRDTGPDHRPRGNANDID